MEQKQKFALSVPPGLHGSILKACEDFEHVETDAKGMTVTPPDGEGLVLRIEPIPGSQGEVEVTIVENPAGIHVVHIRSRLLEDIKKFEKHAAGESEAAGAAESEQNENPGLPSEPKEE